MNTHDFSNEYSFDLCKKKALLGLINQTFVPSFL